MQQPDRQEMARRIAETSGAVERDGRAWSVTITPKGEGSEDAEPLRFRVTAPAPGLSPTCTCPAFRSAARGRLVVCEHILAVGYYRAAGQTD
jgi:hypothetical protein